jgi:hypothetical protein
MPLDEILQPFGNVTLWKIDVEGFELDVLRGAEHSLSNQSLKAVLLEGDSKEIEEIMLRHGFSRAIYDPFSRIVEPAQHSQIASSGRTNNLWIRDYAMVGDRCKTARKYVVHQVEF